VSKDSGTTTTDLFEKEMQYLHDNEFKVLTMSDLRAKAKRIYVPILGINSTKAG